MLSPIRVSGGNGSLPLCTWWLPVSCTCRQIPILQHVLCLPPAVSLWLHWESPSPQPSLITVVANLQTYIFHVLLFCSAYLFKNVFRCVLCEWVFAGIWLCVPCACSPWGGQKGVTDPLKLWLQAAVSQASVLGTELRFYGKAASALNC